VQAHRRHLQHVALPSAYQGSITQSWPKATLTPAASSSGTRVMPRRLGVAVVPALQRDVDQRVGHRVQAGLGISGSSLLT
jgi:hypothetical protein